MPAPVRIGVMSRFSSLQNHQERDAGDQHDERAAQEIAERAHAFGLLGVFLPGRFHHVLLEARDDQRRDADDRVAQKQDQANAEARAEEPRGDQPRVHAGEGLDAGQLHRRKDQRADDEHEDGDADQADRAQQRRGGGEAGGPIAEERTDEAPREARDAFGDEIGDHEHAGERQRARGPDRIAVERSGNHASSDTSSGALLQPRNFAAPQPAVHVERLLENLHGVFGAHEILDDHLLVLERLVVLEEAADLAQRVRRQLPVIV